ncbi:extracellular matrix/biofilm biosynthesis regulator RemA family protein [Chloroflexota bacterium]
MSIELVHIGFDNFVATHRIVAIASTNSASIRRTIKEAEGKGLLLDMTHGRKTRAVIVTDTNHIFLTSRAPEIIASRLQANRVSSPLRPELSDEKGEA